jgi:hypothetical protein
MKKAEIFSFSMVPGSGGHGQSLHGEILGDALMLRSYFIDFGGARQKYLGFENKGSKNNFYVGSTINHHRIPPENTLNMASAADDSKLPSLSSPVPPSGNDSQRYRDGSPQLFSS